jgi:hypothetical protein
MFAEMPLDNLNGRQIRGPLAAILGFLRPAYLGRNDLMFRRD